MCQDQATTPQTKTLANPLPDTDLDLSEDLKSQKQASLPVQLQEHTMLAHLLEKMDHL